MQMRFCRAVAVGLCLVIPALRSDAGLRVDAIGEQFTPDPDATVCMQRQFSTGGTTSVRNDATPEWKDKGYYQRNRDLGQVFTAGKDFTLDAIVLRTGPSDKAVMSGAIGAKVFVQFFEVIGVPRVHDNNTPPGAKATHGFTENHRADDYIVGISLRPIRVARGGVFPRIPVTSADNQLGRYHYLRWDLTGRDEFACKAGRRYAFMVGFEEPGAQRSFSLANRNDASDPGEPSFDDSYPGGFGLRREGNGITPPVMKPGLIPDPSLLSQSLFAAGRARYELAPVTDGYPDVDTYRDLEFYLEAK